MGVTYLMSGTKGEEAHQAYKGMSAMESMFGLLVFYGLL